MISGTRHSGSAQNRVAEDVDHLGNQRLLKNIVAFHKIEEMVAQALAHLRDLVQNLVAELLTDDRGALKHRLDPAFETAML